MQRSMFKRHFQAMGWHTGRAGGFGDLSYLQQTAYTGSMSALLDRAAVWDGPVNAGRLQQLVQGRQHLLLYKVG